MPTPPNLLILPQEKAAVTDIRSAQLLAGPAAGSRNNEKNNHERVQAVRTWAPLPSFSFSPPLPSSLLPPPHLLLLLLSPPPPSPFVNSWQHMLMKCCPPRRATLPLPKVQFGVRPFAPRNPSQFTSGLISEAISQFQRSQACGTIPLLLRQCLFDKLRASPRRAEEARTGPGP